MTAGRALVLGVTGDLGFAAGAVVASFLRHNADFDGDIVVMHDGLPGADVAALGCLAPRLRLVTLDPAAVLGRLVQGGLTDPALLRRLGRWGAMTLAKFEMFDWLDRYETVVWADADLLVQGPVPDLWQAGPLAWRPLPEGSADRRQPVLAALADRLRRPETPFPNGGVVVAGAGLRASGVTAATLYAHAAWLLAHTRARSVDELALFMLAAVQDIPVQALPPDLNHPADQTGAAGARVVHAIGPDKFWNAAALRHGFPGWTRAHADWLAAGGSAAPAPDQLLQVHPDDPAEVLAFARNRAYWQALWPALGPALPRGVWPDLRTERAVLRLFLTGVGRQLWLDLGRTASPRRLRVGIGAERRKLPDPALPDRIGFALSDTPALTLSRHDGRRLTEWHSELPLEAVPEAVQILRDAVVSALEP